MVTVVSIEELSTKIISSAKLTDSRQTAIRFASLKAEITTESFAIYCTSLSGLSITLQIAF